MSLNLDAVASLIASRIVPGAPGSIRADTLRSTLLELVTAIIDDLEAGNVAASATAPIAGSNVQAALDSIASVLSAKANSASPVLTGTPTAPTAATAVSSQQIATTAYVKACINQLLAGVSADWDTLSEIAGGLAAKLDRDAGLADLTNKQAGFDALHVRGGDIASAATINLDTATGSYVVVTGTTAITAITLADGRRRLVRFSGALTLTHGASLLLPTTANIITAAGDIAEFQGEAGGVVRCTDYRRANGQALSLAAFDKATAAEAAAGTDDIKGMTPLATSRHLIANGRTRNIAGRAGGFEVWQRGTSISVAAATVAYTVDGWYLATGANQAHTVSQTAGLVAASSADVRVQRNAGQTGTGVVRFAMPLALDELIALRGRAAVLSFQTRAGANWSPASGTLSYAVYVGTSAVSKRNGTPYTAETTPITGTVNLTPGAAVQQVVAAVSAALPNTITSAEIQFFWTPSGTAGANDWIEIDDVQLEVVPAGITTVAPQFERLTLVEQLLRAYRFLVLYSGALSGPWVSGYQNAGNTIYNSYPLPVEMHADPTCTRLGTWAVANCGQPSFVALGRRFFYGAIVATATGPALANPDSADDGVLISAEI